MVWISTESFQWLVLEHLSEEGKQRRMGHGAQGSLRQASGKDGDLVLTYHVSTACSGTYPQGKPPKPKFISASPALAASPWQGAASQTSPKHGCSQTHPAEQPKWLHLQTNHCSHQCLGPQSPNLSPTPQIGKMAPQHHRDLGNGGFTQEMTLMEATPPFAHTRMGAVQHLSFSFTCV